MGRALWRPTMSAPDYLELEATQTIRHEFVDGEVFAMAGGDDRHATAVPNVAMALRQHLVGTPCGTYLE